MSDVPSGFEALATASPFNKNVGPYYCKPREGQLVIGLRVEEKHCNSVGKLHGAMFAAIADIALGHNIALALTQGAGDRVAPKSAGIPRAPIATVSLSTDFVGSAEQGDWVEVAVDVQRAGRTLAFANAYLMVGKARIGRASGVFRVLPTRS